MGKYKDRDVHRVMSIAPQGRHTFFEYETLKKLNSFELSRLSSFIEDYYVKNEKRKLDRLEAENKELLNELIKVRQLLLPHVMEGTACGDFVACTSSSIECISHLAENIAQHILKLKAEQR